MGKKLRDGLAIVGVGDVESVAAWCGHREILGNHGGGLGKERSEMERKKKRSLYCSRRSNEASVLSVAN